MKHSFALLSFLLSLVAVSVAPSTNAQTIDYTGTWFNNTFMSTGAARGSQTITGNTLNASVELADFVFNVAPPGGLGTFHDPLNLTGTINPDGSIDIDDVNDHPLFGDLTNASVAVDGTFTGLLNDIQSNTAIDNVVLGGTVFPQAINLTYDVTFTDASTADGTIDLVLVPEPGTAGMLLGLIGLGLIGTRSRRRTS